MDALNNKDMTMRKTILSAFLIASLAGGQALGNTTTLLDKNMSNNYLLNTAAIIGGVTSGSLYYKSAPIEGVLTIVDPNEMEAFFNELEQVETSYGLFSITTSGHWVYEVPISSAHHLGDLNEGETERDTVTVTSVDGTSQQLTFTILSADDAPNEVSPDDGDTDNTNNDGNADNNSDDANNSNTDTCLNAVQDDGSTDASPIVSGNTYHTTVDDLNTLLNSGSVTGGDEVIVSGEGEISLKNRCFDAQVLIRAEHVGSVTLDSATINNSQYIALQGFTFGPHDNSTLLKIADSKNIKILRNTFDHKDITDGQNSIVLTESSEVIAIAYNEFLDKNIVVENDDGQINSGSYIKFQYDDDTGSMTKSAHIHHNYFKNIVPYIKTGETTPEGDSDREAIVFGDSGSQDVETHHLIEYNLFEDCDGENEIMTVKTSNNEFSHNTFLNSMGSLSFRLGHDNKAENNYFYGTGESTLVTDANYQTGGIRVYGANHIVSHNYMQNLSGTSWRSPILIDSGDVSDSSNGNSHEAPTNVIVSDNTLVDNLGGGIYIGRDNYSIEPTTISITDNIVTGGEAMLFDNYADESSNVWSGNQAYATGSAIANGGASLSNNELEIVSSAPSIITPTPLSTSDVGPAADL